MKTQDSMIHQLLAHSCKKEALQAGARVRIRPDVLIMDAASAEILYSLPEKEHLSLPIYVVDNQLPMEGYLSPEKIEALQKRGISYLNGGRSGFPALVAAEEGLAFPGALIACSASGAAELGVFGAMVLRVDSKSLPELLKSGELEISVPNVCSIELHSAPSEWAGGIDIALALLKYYELPENKNCYLEFSGPGLSGLSLAERHNLLRVLEDLAYPQLLCQIDEQCMAFLQDRSEGEAKFFFPTDKSLTSLEHITVDLSGISPMIAWKSASALQIGNLMDKDGLPIHQVIIGADTACRYEDFEAGLKLIRYRMLPEYMNACLLPGSQLVHADLLDMGIAGIFTEIGFQIFPAAFFSQLLRFPDLERTRLSSSASILENGGYLAGALSCFCAAMTGMIIHPMEMENLLKKEEIKHLNDESEE